MRAYRISKIKLYPNIMNYEIIKRNFEALKHPQGSEARKRLNQNDVTSEYMPSYHWEVVGGRCSLSFKTREEALNFVENTSKEIVKRLEYIRGEIREERISTGEICELQSLANYIEPGDVELLEWAGVPEFEEKV